MSGRQSWSFFAIMAPIDLNKNKDAIVKAHKEVSDPKNETNWQVLCVLCLLSSACPVEIVFSVRLPHYGWSTLRLIHNI